MEELRRKQGWSLSALAHKAGVSYKTLSKLELDRIIPRRPEILLRVAKAFDVHPDRLLVRASLTPMLRPQVDEASRASPMTPLTLLVNDDERRHLEDYLQFLRYIASIKALCQKAETKVELPNQHFPAKGLP
jgi:transcriptional regulator with XRE-family HTH domain